MTRYLTKTRFKLGVQCATKLFYTGKPEYVNRSLDNSFLAALAEGGHQVGALACLMHPGGIAVKERNHDEAVEKTRQLLVRDSVTVYEAAFAAEGMFVRVDVLRKRGKQIELIEVKAKSYSPGEDGDMCGTDGAIKSKFLPYLQDVAFQFHVARLARPEFEIRPYLMLVDKSTRATVSGLSQRFVVRRHNSGVHIEVAPDTNQDALGLPLLRAVPVDAQVQAILGGTLDVGQAGPLPFQDAVQRMTEAYASDVRIEPKPGSNCHACEFRSTTVPLSDDSRSGFHECWGATFGMDRAAFERGTVLDLWNLRKKQSLIESRILELTHVRPEDLGFDGSDPGTDGILTAHRQWYQASGEWPGGGDFYFAAQVFRNARNKWTYPLHFIDFETSAVPIPFFEGSAPYETTAFQFSHHVMHADGRVEHRSQFIHTLPAVRPNFDFVRALRETLCHDEGTVFRWAAHENTVLNHIRQQLLVASPAPSDLNELLSFIDSITSRESGAVTGQRSMVDLCALAQQAFFHPATKGSSSLKQVLPALMNSSELLRSLYGEPGIYGTDAMPSLNFTQPMSWWQLHDGKVCDPYRLLPPIFTDITRAEVEELESATDELLKDGGAAMAAYARLQAEALVPHERAAIKAALLRYCELDTLAMVMAVQAWQDWADNGI